MWLDKNTQINYLDYKKNLQIRNLNYRTFAHVCISIIERPTRVTSKTVALIDNISSKFYF